MKSVSLRHFLSSTQLIACGAKNDVNAVIIDALIIFLYFAGIITLGLYMGRRENSLHDFALGGRSVPWWAVMASIIAAETSAATFLGTPGEGYTHKSIVYAQLVIGMILGRLLVGFVFLKPYYTFKVYTVYDYLAVRFGNKSKNYASALFLIMRTLASGTRLFIPAIVLVLAWQMFQKGGQVAYMQDKSQVGAYVVAIILVTVLTCIYTALGGIKAVIWTDVVQATLMFTSAIVAIVTILYHIGGDSWNLMNGFQVMLSEVPQMKKSIGYVWMGWEPERIKAWVDLQAVSVPRRILDPDNLSAWEWIRMILGNEYTIFSAVIGGTLGNMAAFGTDQDMVQRMLTAETYQKSRRSLITAALMDLPIYAGFSFIGVLLFVYYKQQSGTMPNANDAFGTYILQVMPVGVRGLVLAGVFATAMGSLSAALNALATSATNDWYIPYFGRNRSESHHVAAARMFTTVFAVLMILIAVGTAYAKLVNPALRIIPVVVGVAGLFLGPMLGVFLVGMLTRKRGSDAGNIIAITVTLIAMVFLSGNHVEFANLYHPSEDPKVPTYILPAWMPVVKWTWFAMIGALITFVIAVLFPTPRHMVESARRKVEDAHLTEDVPLHLRK